MTNGALRRALLLLIPAFLPSLFLAGCGSDGPELAPVEGTVRLDGQPLEGATVVFQPSEGRPSRAETDARGRYELWYTSDKRGAIVGKHKVTISTCQEPDPDSDDPARQKGVPERVPAKFNEESELERDVQSGGSTLDFDLDSKR